MSRIKFMNIQIDNFTMQESLDKIDELIQKGKRSYVVTPNVDHLVMLQKDELFKRIYDEADLVLADGKPLIWISKLYKRPLKEKVSGSDLFPKVCELAAEKEYKMYFLGAAEGVAAEAARRLKCQYPKLEVVGTYSPPIGFEKDNAEVEKIISKINSSNADILIIGLGAPKQEKFFYNHKDEINVSIALGLGASFDFVAGNVKRAPRWLCNCGFEWLYRITQDPKRLAKRYIKDAVKIVPLIIKYWK